MKFSLGLLYLLKIQIGSFDFILGTCSTSSLPAYHKGLPIVSAEFRSLQVCSSTLHLPFSNAAVFSLSARPLAL